ncbi:MAG: hypothetical protein LBG78_09535 [Azoarcus sp.]|jgi:hypothetical protein|nr:hypothetical protein [Azoarcus sp.]
MSNFFKKISRLTDFRPPSFSIGFHLLQKLPYLLGILILVLLNISAKADCIGTEDPETQEDCVPYEEDYRLLTPPAYRNIRFNVSDNPYCDIDVSYPVFSIPVLDKKIREMANWTEALNECPTAATPEEWRYHERLHISYTVLRPSCNVLVVYFDYYTQGAGGPSYWHRGALNYDLARHKFLELKDLFKDFDALANTEILDGLEVPFLIPDGIVTHRHSGLGGPGPTSASIKELLPYRPVMRYWNRTGCKSARPAKRKH